MSGVPSTTKKSSTVLEENKARGIIVDPEDEWLLEEQLWTVAEHGYAVRGMKFGERWVPTYLHHYIVGQPIWLEVDHENRNRLDNRRSNLKYKTHQQNLLNHGQALGMTGIRHTTQLPNGQYMVQIKRHGIRHYLGCFATLDEAVATRDEWLYTNGG